MRLTIGEELIFELEGLPADLEEQVSRHFAHYLNRGPAGRCRSLRISADPPPGDATAPDFEVASRPPLTVRHREQVLLYEVQGVRGWCDLQTGQAGIQAGQAPARALEVFVVMALPSMLFELAGERGWLGVHAAAIAIAGQGILLPGPSGVGKTTLFEQAHRSGLQVLSDDLVWLQEEPAGSFRLWAGPAVGSGDHQIQPTTDGVALAAFACPAIGGGSEPCLKSLSPLALLPVLLGQSSFLALGALAGDRFRRLARAADSAPAYRLEAVRGHSRQIDLLRQTVDPR